MADPSQPETMSILEVRKSLLLTGADLTLFVFSGLVAGRLWLEARSRERELRRRASDSSVLQPLGRRRLLVQMLCATCLLRALGLLSDMQFHVFFYYGHKKKMDYPWHHCFDYLVSSLPSLVWLSTLSFLVVFFAESYQRSYTSRSTFLYPTVMFFNVIGWLWYIALTVTTMQLSLCRLFRARTYLTIGLIRVVLASTLLWYGIRLALRLSARSLKRGARLLPVSLRPEDAFVVEDCCGGQSSGNLVCKVWVLATLLPGVEFIRFALDVGYVYEWTTNPLYKRGIVYVALGKLLFEWLPSTVLLLAFTPDGAARPPHGQRCLETVAPLSAASTLGELRGLDSSCELLR